MNKKDMRFIKIFLCVSVIAAVFLGIVPVDANASGYVDRIIVRYDDGMAKAIKSGVMSTSSLHTMNVEGLRIHSAEAKRSASGRFEVIPVTLGKNTSRKMVLSALQKARGVKYVEFDVPIYACSDPGVSQQYHMNKIEAEQAWSALGNKGNGNFVVAVMDTGIDIDHPDLTDALWVNANEIPGNNIDDDSNGFIDDIYGWNFYSQNGNVDDDNGHGTHVSGIIAARENGVGITGIAPNTKVMSFKILNADGNGFLSDVALALDLIRDYKTRSTNPVDIKAINMSFGATAPIQSVKEAIDEFGELGIAVFAAAGNESQDNDMFPGFPANYGSDALVSVGSINSDNSLSWFTNYGEASVQVYAYGDNIYSTYMDGGYETQSGSSMAAPVALGCFLLGWSSNPSMNVYEALAKFHSGLEPTPQVPLGRAHAKKAVTTALPSQFAYKFREFLTLFSTSGDLPIPGTLLGTGLGNSTFTMGNETLNKAAGGENYQEVYSDTFSLTENLYKDVRINNNTSIKRLNIKTATRQVVQDGLMLGRVLVHEGLFARKGSWLYFFAMDCPRDIVSSGTKYFVAYNLADGEWREHPISSAYDYDVDGSRGMFIYGNYVYAMNRGWGDNQNILFRYNINNNRFDIVTRTMPSGNMSDSCFAWGNGKVWFIGNGVYCQVSEFDPETGTATPVFELPDNVYDGVMAYRNGKLYITGGKYSTSSYVVNIEDGECYTVASPFAGLGGQLLFGENRLYYLLPTLLATGDFENFVSPYGYNYLVAYADLTTSGWLSEWKLHPEFVEPKVLYPRGGILFTSVEDTALEGTPERFLYLFSVSPDTAWVAGGYNAPAGTIQPDPDTPTPEPEPEPEPTPVPPTPDSGGGGGCNTVGGNPAFLMLLVPSLLLVRGRK